MSVTATEKWCPKSKTCISFRFSAIFKKYLRLNSPINDTVFFNSIYSVSPCWQTSLFQVVVTIWISVSLIKTWWNQPVTGLLVHTWRLHQICCKLFQHVRYNSLLLTSIFLVVPTTKLLRFCNSTTCYKVVVNKFVMAWQTNSIVTTCSLQACCANNSTCYICYGIVLWIFISRNT